MVDVEVDDEDENDTGEPMDPLTRLLRIRSSQNFFESPIDLNIAAMKVLHLPDLEFNYLETPCKKMKLLNSGHTIILSARWFDERPFIYGGPLPGKYVFSQLHFHWGSTDLEGSEHTIDGTQYPLEMHVVFFKSSYSTQEAALLEKDGVTILTYIFKLQSQKNEYMQQLLDAAKLVKHCGNSIKTEKFPLCLFVRPFSSDYFIYWGSIATSICSHIVLYIISREPMGISAKQLEIFRRMLDDDDKPILRNFRNVQPNDNINVYHINPTPMKYATLLPIPREEFLQTKKMCKDR